MICQYLCPNKSARRGHGAGHRDSRSLAGDSQRCRLPLRRSAGSILCRLRRPPALLRCSTWCRPQGKAHSRQDRSDASETFAPHLKREFALRAGADEPAVGYCDFAGAGRDLPVSADNACPTVRNRAPIKAMRCSIRARLARTSARPVRISVTSASPADTTRLAPHLASVLRTAPPRYQRGARTAIGRTSRTGQGQTSAPVERPVRPPKQGDCPRPGSRGRGGRTGRVPSEDRAPAACRDSRALRHVTLKRLRTASPLAVGRRECRSCRSRTPARHFVTMEVRPILRASS